MSIIALMLRDYISPVLSRLKYHSEYFYIHFIVSNDPHFLNSKKKAVQYHKYHDSSNRFGNDNDPHDNHHYESIAIQCWTIAAHPLT